MNNARIVSILCLSEGTVKNHIRHRFLPSYERGEETVEELTDRLIASLAFGKKPRRQFRRTGQIERIEQRQSAPCGG